MLLSLASLLVFLGSAAARDARPLRGTASLTSFASRASELDPPLGPEADLVTHLPGYGPPPTPQYSGFLDASAAEPGTKLHYWFARADASDWATKPTVLWLNGGPGSSSILGWLQEVGPLLVNRTGGLMRNPWSWTLEANVFALESPAGVGYSYCEAQLGGGACANTDNSTAAAALAGLVDFFQNKFPSLAANPFYVTGESYAGVYVPTLSRAILDHNDAGGFLIPLAGLAAGDPCTDNDFQRDSMDMLWYGHKHGFVAEADFDLLWNECGVRHPSAKSRGRWTRDSRWPSGWREEEDAAREAAEGSAAAAAKRYRGSTLPDPTPECVAARRRFLLATSDAFSQEWRHAWLNDLSLYGPSAVVRDDVPGTLDFDMSTWMARADVRAALHVEDAPADVWPGPSDDWSYESQWGACNDAAPPGTPSMVDFYRYLAPRLRRTIVFNGDTDPCVSYEGTRAAVEAVGFPKLDGGAQRPYFVNATGVPLALLDEKPLLFGPSLAVVPAGPQFGGHVTDYANGLAFVTVHGSGHMVPQFRPRAGLHLLRKLVRGGAFAPPMRSQGELETMTHEAWMKEMDAWTVEAQGTEYVD
jgi:cathepsin A (carboxypeptidase C)